MKGTIFFKNRPSVISFAATAGKVVDSGITDANNIGAVMAPAAYDTLSRHFENTGTTISDYDLILTGDLGEYGAERLRELFKEDGIDLWENYNDCGIMLYDTDNQNVYSGASGAGASAAVMCGYVFDRIKKGELKNVLFAGTGALFSTVRVLQNETIPCIANVIHIAGE